MEEPVSHGEWKPKLLGRANSFEESHYRMWSHVNRKVRGDWGDLSSSCVCHSASGLLCGVFCMALCAEPKLNCVHGLWYLAIFMAEARCFREDESHLQTCILNLVSGKTGGDLTALEGALNVWAPCCDPVSEELIPGAGTLACMSHQRTGSPHIAHFSDLFNA